MGFSIKNKMNVSFTTIPNNFIDEYMVKANGEFVKVYLYVQSQIQANLAHNLTICSIADKLECTEKDVQRAFAYWEKEGVLSLETDEGELATPKASPVSRQEGRTDSFQQEKQAPQLRQREQADSFQQEKQASQFQKEEQTPQEEQALYGQTQQEAYTSAKQNAYPQDNRRISAQSIRYATTTQREAVAAKDSVPSKAILPPTILESQIEDAGLSQLVYMADMYLGKPLSQTDLNTLFYFHDQLHFSVELIEFLIEHCVSNGKNSMRYMETVAISWYEKHITTVKEAKAQIQSRNKNYYSVMRALGITNRSPIPSEEELIKKWFHAYNFELAIVLEACKRTIQKTHQPSFAYADKILSSWYTSKVQSLDDIKALDEEHQLANPVYTKKASDSSASNANNRFHNFNQRNYDFDSLEQQLDQQLLFQFHPND